MLLAILTALAAAGPAPFTLDQVMSAPFPTDLVAAHGHPRVAWVMNAKGSRNVWVAEGPDYAGRAVTTFTGDDGEEITDLAFTADAQAVVFVRGGEPNRAGEIPNPRSRTEARERAVHVVTLAGLSRRLAEGYSPRAKPPREPHRLHRQEPGLRSRPGRRSEAGAALRRPRRPRLAALLGRRRSPRLREQPGRPRLRGRLRPRREVHSLDGPRRRSGWGARLFSRRQEPRVPAPAGAEGPVRVRGGARGRALVDPSGRGGERQEPRGVPGRQGTGQRLRRGDRLQPGPLGCGRPAGVSLGEDRLAAPLFGRRGRRPAPRPHRRRVRGRARLARALRNDGRLQLERERHRSATPLGRARGRRRSRAPHHGHRHPVVAGHDERRRPRLLPLLGHPPRAPRDQGGRRGRGT